MLRALRALKQPKETVEFHGVPLYVGVSALLLVRRTSALIWTSAWARFWARLWV